MVSIKATADNIKAAKPKLPSRLALVVNWVK